MYTMASSRQPHLDWKAGKERGPYTVAELKKLYVKAIEFQLTGNLCGQNSCKVLHRNKPAAYFNAVYNTGGVMWRYPKDRNDRPNGDPRSPINNPDYTRRPQGLFFSPNVVHGTDIPIPKSNFGDTRLEVPIDQLIDRQSDRLFFADFYCLRDKQAAGQTPPHYVTLVITRPQRCTINGPNIYNITQWCEQNLVELRFNCGFNIERLQSTHAAERARCLSMLHRAETALYALTPMPGHDRKTQPVASPKRLATATYRRGQPQTQLTQRHQLRDGTSMVGFSEKSTRTAETYESQQLQMCYALQQQLWTKHDHEMQTLKEVVRKQACRLNPFFHHDGTGWKVSSQVWVEILYTDDIYIGDKLVYTMPNISPNMGMRLHPLPKNPKCCKCNL